MHTSRIAFAFVLAGILLWIVSTHNSVTAAENSATVDLIVEYGTSDDAALRHHALAHDAKIKRVEQDLNIALIEMTLSEGEDADDVVARVERMEGIVRAEVNRQFTPHFIPDDPLFVDQWSHHNTGQTTSSGITGTEDADMDLDEAYEWQGRDSEVYGIVAVIDSGINYEHPDAGLLWDGSDLCLDADKEEIEGGCPHSGWEFYYDRDDPYDEGHGAAVASIIHAVTDNATGMAGTSKHDTIAIMGLATPGLYTYDIYRAIHFAQNNGARVINASFGGLYYSRFLRDAIASFDGIFVTSAGNGGEDGEGDNIDSESTYPCSYDLDNVICVAATDSNDNLATFSNYGDDSVDIAAPGVGIVIAEGEDDYSVGDGTSFAAPFVSALAAHLYAHTASLTVDQVKTLIFDGADKPASLSGLLASEGRVNMHIPLARSTTFIGFDLAPYVSNGDQDKELKLTSDTYTSYFTTDRPASCQYAETPNTPYASANVEGDGTVHAITFDDLEEGEEYIVYVRCEDTLTQSVNDADYQISFRALSVGEFQQGSHAYVYRFWSPVFRHHFFTISAREAEHLAYSDPNWDFENVAYVAHRYDHQKLTPVYRFWNDTFKGHFYTKSETEKDNLIANNPSWEYEGIAYYVYAVSGIGTGSERQPVYRFWSDTFKGHFYTKSETEKDNLIQSNPNWEYEGIAWWVDRV